MTRQPRFKVIGHARTKTHVSGAETHDTVMQSEALQNAFGRCRHALQLFSRLFGRGDGDKLNLGELVLTDHAAGISACRSGFRAETGRASGEAHRQLCFIENGFTHKIGEGDFSRGDEPAAIGGAKLIIDEFW